MPIGPGTDLGSSFFDVKSGDPKTDHLAIYSFSDIGSLVGGMYQQVAVKKKWLSIFLSPVGGGWAVD